MNHDDKPASAHDIRLSSGQRLADAGVPPLLLQSIMRQTESATTQRHYLPNDAAKEPQQLEAHPGTLAEQCAQEESQPSDVSPELA